MDLQRCDVCGQERPPSEFITNPRLTRAVCNAHAHLRCLVCNRELDAPLFSIFLNRPAKYDDVPLKGKMIKHGPLHMSLPIPQRPTLWNRLTQDSSPTHHVKTGKFYLIDRAYGEQRCDACINTTTCERCHQPFTARPVHEHFDIIEEVFLLGTPFPELPTYCDKCRHLQPLNTDELATIQQLARNRS